MFKDRVDAGRQLAERLKILLAGSTALLVLGVPRGGVVVAAEVAKAIGAPLDIVVARKIGSPMNAEYAIGAVGVDGSVILDEAMVDHFQVSTSYIDSQVRKERAEMDRRLAEYRKDGTPCTVAGKTVIVVDDGVATGMTIRAAIRSIRVGGPSRIILALPVAPPSTLPELEKDADEVIVLLTPEPFYAVGQWYTRFEQTSDAEVRRILAAGIQDRSGTA